MRLNWELLFQSKTTCRTKIFWTTGKVIINVLKWLWLISCYKNCDLETCVIGNFGSVASYIYDHVCDDSGVTCARSREPAKLSISFSISFLCLHIRTWLQPIISMCHNYHGIVWCHFISCNFISFHFISSVSISLPVHFRLLKFLCSFILFRWETRNENFPRTSRFGL